ncbi:MAG: DUF6504 family protein [Bacillota bacterium]
MKSPAGELKVVAENGVPRSFKWRGRRYAVRAVLERWKDTGRWWKGEAPKLFFRVETAGGGLWEIYLDTDQDRWFLYRIYD